MILLDRLQAAIAMATLDDWLRVCVIVLWAGVFLYEATTLTRLLRGGGNKADPIGALLAGFGGMVIGYHLRFYAGASNELFHSGLHVFSALLACATFAVARTVKQVFHD